MVVTSHDPASLDESGVPPAARRLSAAAVMARVEGTRRRLERQRPKHPLVDAVFRAIDLLSESGAPLLAGAIAFRFFLFLVPCVFVLVTGLGLGADVANADVRDVARTAGIAGVAATAIQSSAGASTATQWVTFSIALFALVLGARNLLKALWLSHALIWGTRLQRPPRPTLAGLALVAVFAVATVLLRGIYVVRTMSFAAWVLGLVLYILVPAGIWLVCSRWLFPAPSGVTWHHVWPGALLFGLGSQALHVATVLWVAPSMHSKSTTYGAIGAALTLLLWAYMLGRLVTSSAALNAALWRRSAGGAPPRPTPHGAPGRDD